MRYKVCKDEFSRLLKEFDTDIEEIKLEPVGKEKVFENLDARTQQKLNLEMVLFTPFMQLQNLPSKDEQQKVGSPKNEIYYSTVIRNSRSLHPKLTIQFVKKYFSNATNRNIQLVTTTHESRIMSHDIVRRDEIWIADTNEDDSTKLFSLEDKQVRIDKILDQNYMDNVWGGVPVFEDEEE